MNRGRISSKRFLLGFAVLLSANLVLLLLRFALNGTESASTGNSTPAVTMPVASPAAVTPQASPLPAIVPTNAKITETPLPVPSPSPSPLPTLPSPSPAGPIVHVIQPNETLESIAAQYGVTVDALVEENDIQDPDLIIVGTRLRIPVQDSE
jgi:LysM repeat protein